MCLYGLCDLLCVAGWFVFVCISACAGFTDMVCFCVIYCGMLYGSHVYDCCACWRVRICV